jgi:glycosyltransferase involved in cell wall biosynthesis
VSIKKSFITYVFGFGRTELINSDKIFAKEFFYGYFDFRAEYKSVNFIEFENNIPNNFFNFLLTFMSKVLRKVTKLSFFLDNICTYKNFKVLLNSKNIILTNDRIGLSLLPFLIIFKVLRKPKSTVIVMGLLAKNTNNLVSHVSQRILLNLFFYSVDNFVFLSVNEYKQAIISFKRFRNKFFFVPFCIDSKFWEDKELSNNKKNIIFVGNDSNRRYDLVLEIARSLTEFNFIFVTSEINRNEINSNNIKFYKGSWNKQLLSDIELRELYSTAYLSILPLKDSYQPSGQSVALQSMSMGIPVLITKTIGFWDDVFFENKKNILFIEDNNLIGWINKIQNISKNQKLQDLVSMESKKLIEKEYNLENFYNSIKKIILE